MHGFIRIMTAQMPAYANISLAFCHFAEPLTLPLLRSSPPPLLPAGFAPNRRRKASRSCRRSEGQHSSWAWTSQVGLLLLMAASQRQRNVRRVERGHPLHNDFRVMFGGLHQNPRTWARSTRATTLRRSRP